MWGILGGVKHRWKGTRRQLKGVWMLILSGIREWMPSEWDFVTKRVIKANEGSNIEHIWQTSWRLGFYRGGPVFMSALSGIDIALWDLKGTNRRKRSRIIADD